jgi:hypothetical protein
MEMSIYLCILFHADCIILECVKNFVCKMVFLHILILCGVNFAILYLCLD